jgi:uncharacterized protein YraI
MVEILGRRNEWLETRYRGRPAFVSGEYLDVQERPLRRRGIITARLLNVRDRPGTNGVILGTLVNGSLVDILGEDHGWMEIPFQDSTAYVSSDYVEQYIDTSARQGRVIADLLNVRANPNAKAPILGQLTGGASVEVLAELGSFLEIAFNAGRGYVANQYVQILDPLDGPAPVPVVTNRIEESVTPLEQPRPASRETGNITPVQTLPVLGDDTERAVAKIWNRFGGLLQELCAQRDIDIASAVAVISVESGGKGFDPANRGRMIIRFENHKFWKYWGRTDPNAFRQHFEYSQEKSWLGHKWRRYATSPWQKFHGDQRAEWEVLTFARSLDDAAALKSISMGAPQIMGFNHLEIGYRTVQEMFEAFSTDIGAQIVGLFDFCSEAMIDSLRRRDFVAFARGYNGSGQAEKYGNWIRKRHQAFNRIGRSIHLA